MERNKVPQRPDPWLYPGGVRQHCIPKVEYCRRRTKVKGECTRLWSLQALRRMSIVASVLFHTLTHSHTHTHLHLCSRILTCSEKIDKRATDLIFPNRKASKCNHPFSFFAKPPFHLRKQSCSKGSLVSTHEEKPVGFREVLFCINSQLYIPQLSLSGKDVRDCFQKYHHRSGSNRNSLKRLYLKIYRGPRQPRKTQTR